MSSRALLNHYPDFCEKNATKFFSENGLDNEIKIKIDRIIRDLWLKIEDRDKDLVKNEYTIYTGYCGIAYTYFILGRKTDNKMFLERAENLCAKAIGALKNKRVSFLNGDAGPLALGVAIYHHNGKFKDSESFLNRLVDLVETVLQDNSLPDEILFGRAGYLYALLFVNKFIGEGTIPQELIRKVVEEILSSGRSLARSQGYRVPLMYQWHNKQYLGAAHGFSGILYILLCARDVLTETELDTIIRPTIDWLLNFRYQSLNFASSMGSESDRLVQWCHGAPGFVHLYTLAHKVFHDAKYLKVALDCGDVVWQRGLLSKGYSICHGISGNAYTFMHLYKYTQDIKHRYRLSCFVEWCTKYPENQGILPDRPFSLFEGVAGVIYFLEECKDPMNSCFPGYEL